MYIRHLQVQNLKRLNDFGLSFVHRGKPRMWTVLIGENGTAKTTLLQAIAMAAAGSKQVNALAAPIVKHLKDRRHDGPMSITADFEFTPSSRAKAQLHPHAPREALASLGLRSRVSLEGGTSLDAEAEYVKIAEDGSAAPLARDPQEERAPKDPLDVARGTHENLWFVAGYGISRVLPDPSKTLPLDRPSIERLMPLFSAEASIASTSFSNHFLTKDVQEGRKQGTTSRMYSRMLNEVIKLGGEDLLPDVVKMELRGQGGVKSAQDLIESDRFQLRMGKKTVAVPGVGMSHGYQSTFAWIADLVGHVLLECLTELKTTEIEGLVLLDEIDLYLHPTWQATFITALRRVFPRVQFIATTHSPVVLAGLAPHEIVRLIVEPDSGDVVRGAPDPGSGELVPISDGNKEPPQPDPRPMTGSEIYRTWFGIDRLTPNPHGDALRRYLVLAGDPLRTDADQHELVQLQSELAQAKIEEVIAPEPREDKA